MVVWNRGSGKRGVPLGPERYVLPWVVSPMPQAHRLVPSEKAEHKKPERQFGSPEQVPHSWVEAQEDKAPITGAAIMTIRRLALIDK